MKDKLNILLSKEEIEKRVIELATEIERDYSGEEVVLVSVLSGSCVFLADLARKINGSTIVTFEMIDVSDYETSTPDNRHIRLELDVSRPLTNKNVIVIEDTVETGATLDYIVRHVGLHKPKSIKTCTLLEVSKKRVVDGVKLDYVGFSIEDHTIVGYGMDYQGKYRNLPYVGYLTD
jgi:hypoxanthine phosphoribosyltransferase